MTWVRADPRRFAAIGRWWLSRAWTTNQAIVSVSRFISNTLPARLDSELLYDPAPEAEPVNPNGQRFVFIGNYIEGKGQDVAIAAYLAIAANWPDSRLELHGSTMGLAKNRDNLERLQLAARLVPVAGRIGLGAFVNDPLSVFESALAAINCSNSESFSLACQEASAHGLPVIATRCGGPEESSMTEKRAF